MIKLVGLLLIITCILFFPYFVLGKTPFQANFMVTFFAPWNTMKFPGWEHGIPNKPIGLDNLNLFYPYKQLSIDLMKIGIVPFWNPYNFTGSPLMADFQSAIFYPLNIFYLLLPMIDAWSVMVFIQSILAGIFTFLFLSSLPIQKTAAIFGAITFAFSGEMIVWMGDHLVASHTILWLPLILYAIERRRLILCVLALTFAIFAGFAQPLVYVFVVSFVYALYRRAPWQIYSAFLLSIGIGAIQLLPTFELFVLSPRRTGDVGYLFDQFLMPLSHLISYLAPDYLGNPATYNYLGGGYHESMLSIGVVPLLLIFLVRRNSTVKFFWIVAGLSLLLGLNLPFVRWFYDLGIPLVSTFVPSRIFFINSFALSVLAAFGLHELLAKKSFKRLALLSILCLVVLGIWYLIKAKEPVMQRNLILPGVILACTVILTATKRWIGVGLFVLMIAGQLYFGNKYLAFSDRQFVYPSHPVFTFLQEHAGFNRFWTYGDGYINANFATQYRVYSPDGTDALFPARLGELFYATETKGQYAPSPRIDARIGRAREGESMLTNPYRLRLLSIVGAKYITDWSEGAFLPPPLFTPVWQQEQWHIYEYRDALPRAFLTSDFVVEKDSQKILDKIFENSGKKIVLEQDVKVDTISTGSAVINKYLPNTVSIDVDTQDNTLLYLSDTYYPGWRAYVDGAETKIYRANYAFRAVVVPKEAKRVEFYYKPNSFRWGIIISLASIIIGFFWWHRYER